MEGRGSGVEDWRGEAHLGSSLPVSARHRPCPLDVSRVHALWPVSAHRGLHLHVSAHHCPCPHVLPMVCASFPMSIHICGRSFSFVGVGGSLRSWAVVFIWGQLSSFGGSCLRLGAVVFIRGQSSSFGGIHLHSWAMAGCGGGEPLVGGGESSGLA